MEFLKMLSGDTEIVKHIEEPTDFVFVSDDISSEGFRIQPENFRFKHVFDMGKAGASVWVEAPCDGEYYLALQILDSCGEYDEEFRPLSKDVLGPFCENLIELKVNDEEIGTFNYGGDDRKHYLFITERKISLKKSDRICYKVLSGERAYFTAVILTKKKPLKPVNAILNISADDGEVRFHTNLASKIDLIFGEKIYSNAKFLNNHRFTIPPSLFGLRFQIVATDEEGRVTRGRYVCNANHEDKKLDASVRICLENTLVTGIYAPINSVVPLKEGDVFSGCDFVIQDEGGTSYETDAKVTSRWQDKSIRTISLFAIVPNDGRKFFVVNKVALPKPVDFYAEKTDQGVRIVSGNTVYSFNDEDNSILPDRQFVPFLYDVEMNRFAASGGKFVITENGKNRITVSRKNYFETNGRNCFSSTADLTFYRGIDAYKLDYAFGNEYIEAEHTEIAGLYLEGGNMGGNKKKVYQYYDNRAFIDGQDVEERHDGSFSINDANLKIADFWQNYPKSVEVDEDKFNIGICPFIENPELYKSKDIVYESKLFFYLKGGSYKFHTGLRKYHTIFCATGEQDIAKIENIPFLIPDRKETERTKAFGRILCACEQSETYDEYMNYGLDKFLKRRETNQEYGMMNYGDSHGERHVHWTNQEYDLPYGMLVQFLRTGDHRFYEIGMSAAAHLEEIDCSHRNPFFEERGYFWVHTVGHANNYYTPEEIPNCFILIKSHIGHIFVQGLCECYKMTGIERYKAALLECADTVAEYYTVKYDFMTEREPGWSMLLLEAAYELTLDPYYLNACRLILKRVYEKQDEKTGSLKYYMRLTPDETIKTGDVVYGGKSFMHGILGTAMKYFYYLTGEEKACESAVNIARWLAEDMFDEETNTFWYTDAFKQMGKRTKIVEANIEIIDVIMFAYLKTKKPEYLALVKRAFSAMIGSEYRVEHDIAKVFAMRLRFSPEIMHDLNMVGNM